MSTRQFVLPALAVAILGGAGVIWFTRGQQEPAPRPAPIAAVTRARGKPEVVKAATPKPLVAEAPVLADPVEPAPTAEPAVPAEPMKRYKFEASGRVPDEPAADARSSIGAAAASKVENDLVFVSRADLTRARNAANEAAAIATLRSVSSAQAQAVSSAFIDGDGDGQGEYGFFGELSGKVACRAPRGERPARMQPAVLSSAFGELTPAGNVLRSGYVFRLLLPGATSRDRKTVGVAESSGAPPPYADNCEVLWALYAWPIEASGTGTRAFFVNQEGDLLVMANAQGTYSGEQRAPRFDAAFSAQTPGDMAPPPVPGVRCNDGQVWNLLDSDTAVVPPVELGPATEADLALNEDPKSERVVVSHALLLRAAISDGESRAIRTLRTLCSAEAQIQVMGVVDTDGDGAGEYAYFTEMAGTRPCRAAAGTKSERLEPQLLASSFGKLTSSGNLPRDGYYFRIYLPAKSARGKVPGISESASGGASIGPVVTDHDHCEVLWSVYAWPMESGKSGARAFFMNQDCEIYFTANEDGAYGGDQGAPAFDAAYSARAPGDMHAPLPERGERSNDGRVWRIVM